MRLIALILALTACVSAYKLDFRKEPRISNKMMAQLKEKTKNTVIEKPKGIHTTDIFEINKQNGIANSLYQGDIKLTQEQWNQMTKSSNDTSNNKVSGSRVKRSAAWQSAPKWTDGIVYYYLDDNMKYSPDSVAAVNAAIQFIQSKTCIRFVNSKVETNRIRITYEPGCWSALGMEGGEQVVSIGYGCEVIGIAAHELTHSLGFMHMQSRSDRDQYITLDTSAMDPRSVDQFVKSTVNNSIIYTPYEYGGFMQYYATAFSDNGRFTTIPKDMDYLYTMGNRMISFYDMKMINDHYGCSAKCPVATSAKCQNGGLPNPNNCNTCNCPRGYDGDVCDRMPSVSGGCGAELTATPTWQSISFAFGENTQVERVVFTECHHWIKAPVASKIEVRITGMDNPECVYGCEFNGIEFKLKDPQMTNPKICCHKFMNNVYTSDLNPLPVIAHNRLGVTKFTIEYKYVDAAPVATTPLPGVPTTEGVTTTTTAAAGNCVDTASNCAEFVRDGFCTSGQYSFQRKKYECAKSCNLCGKKADPCIDLEGTAICDAVRSTGRCKSLSPIQAEYYCAKACGYCEHPN